MWILTHAFFAETFQPMNAAVTFQIGLNDSARAIRGKFYVCRCLGKLSGNPDDLYYQLDTFHIFVSSRIKYKKYRVGT